MKARDLGEVFEFVVVQPREDVGRTAVYKKVRQLKLAHHPDKGGRHEMMQKVVEMGQINDFIYRPWSNYDDREKDLFIDFLIRTPNGEIVKAILEYKIQKNICGLGEIQDLLSVKDKEQKSLLAIVSALMDAYPREKKYQRLKRENKEVKKEIRRFNFEQEDFIGLNNEDRAHFLRQFLENRTEVLVRALEHQKRFDSANIIEIYLYLKNHSKNEFVNNDSITAESYDESLQVLEDEVRKIINNECIAVKYHDQLKKNLQLAVIKPVFICDLTKENYREIRDACKDDREKEPRHYMFLIQFLKLNQEGMSSVLKAQATIDKYNPQRLIRSISTQKEKLVELMGHELYQAGIDNVNKIVKITRREGIPREEKFNMMEMSYENIPPGKRVEFLKQLLKSPPEDFKAILEAQKRLNPNSIPHLYISLDARKNILSEEQNYGVLIGEIKGFLLKMPRSEINSEFHGLVSHLQAGQKKSAPSQAEEKKSVPPQAEEKINSAILEESYQNIRNSVNKKVFIDSLFGALIDSEAQKKFLQNQYRLNPKNISDLFKDLKIYSNNKKYKDAPIYQELQALYAADLILKISTGLKGHEFTMTRGLLKDLYEKVGFERIKVYFSEKDQPSVRDYLENLKIPLEQLNMMLWKIQLDKKHLILPSQQSPNKLDKKDEVLPSIQNVDQTLESIKKILSDSKQHIKEKVTEIGNRLPDIEAEDISTIEKRIDKLKLKNFSLTINKWSSYDIALYKFYIVSILDKKANEKGCDVESFKAAYLAKEQDVTVLCQRRYDYTFKSMVKALGKIVLSPFAILAMPITTSGWNKLWKVQGEETKEKIDTELKIPRPKR